MRRCGASFVATRARVIDEFLTRLAQESGIETPTREDLAKLDKTRKNKGSNDDWQNPHDPDAKITKMKDGRTHLAHKPEHGVDMKTGALVAVTLQPANRGDTTSLAETLQQTDANLVAVMKDAAAAEQLNEQVLKELVADKGYHSNAVLTDCAEKEIRTYVSEPDRGPRNWKGKNTEEQATKAARESGGVRQSASDQRRSRQEVDENARRADRTKLRALLRHRRHASDASARTQEYSEAHLDSRGRLQSKFDSAEDDRNRHGARPAGPDGLPLFGDIRQHATHQRGDSSPMENRSRILSAITEIVHRTNDRALCRVIRRNRDYATGC